MPQAAVSAAVLIIGNEILSGRTRDANLQFLAQALGELGIRVREARVVADDEAEIIAAVNALRRRYDYVFTTGGIGPTHDDITPATVAKAFGVPVERNAEAVARLHRQYRPEERNAARMRMADLPAGCSLIDNPISNAPGFRLDNVFVLAGVPRIARAMFDAIGPSLRGGARTLSRTVTIYLAEGLLAAGLAEIQARWTEIEIGSYPFIRHDRLGSAIVLRGTDPGRLDRAAADVAGLARSLGAEPELDGSDDGTVA